MSSISVTYKNYDGFGRCAVVSNGSIELYATLDIGPRVIRLGYIGGDNMFMENPDKTINQHGERMDNYYYKGAQWNIYGGHRMWLSPEYLPETYYPDNDPVSHSLIEGGIVLTPPAQKQNGVQMQMEITMDDRSNTVHVTHKIKNISDKDFKGAIWALSVMRPDIFEVIELPTNEPEFLASMSLALWPYCDLTDHRLTLGKKYYTLRQDRNAPHPFKIGLGNVVRGACIYNGTMFVKSCEYEDSAEYFDYHCNYETYTNENFLEIETLSPAITMKSGCEYSHTETWQLFNNITLPESHDEKAYAKLLAMSK